MLKQYDTIDPLFIKLAIKYRGFFVLRMGTDKILLDMLIHYNKDILSNAHKEFFINIMNFYIDRSFKYDNFYNCEIIAFRSGKHGICDLDGL